MVKITGLAALTKRMGQLARFAEEVDGELATVAFDPTDPSSIETAVSEMEAAIDQKAIAYQGNDMVANLVEQMKANLREQILEKAAAARLEGDDE
jgi:Mg/Co/Ni transporter MgtE